MYDGSLYVQRASQHIRMVLVDSCGVSRPNILHVSASRVHLAPHLPPLMHSPVAASFSVLPSTINPLQFYCNHKPQRGQLLLHGCTCHPVINLDLVGRLPAHPVHSAESKIKP